MHLNMKKLSSTGYLLSQFFFLAAALLVGRTGAGVETLSSSMISRLVALLPATSATFLVCASVARVFLRLLNCGSALDTAAALGCFLSLNRFAAESSEFD